MTLKLNLRSRKQGLARQLMDDLEETTEKIHDAYFVDLFVRVSNASAIQMYNKVMNLHTHMQTFQCSEDDCIINQQDPAF